MFFLKRRLLYNVFYAIIRFLYVCKQRFQKMKGMIKKTADLVTLTEEILKWRTSLFVQWAILIFI